MKFVSHAVTGLLKVGGHSLREIARVRGAAAASGGVLFSRQRPGGVRSAGIQFTSRWIETMAHACVQWQLRVPVKCDVPLALQMNEQTASSRSRPPVHRSDREPRRLHDDEHEQRCFVILRLGNLVSSTNNTTPHISVDVVRHEHEQRSSSRLGTRSSSAHQERYRVDRGPSRCRSRASTHTPLVSSTVVEKPVVANNLVSLVIARQHSTSKVAQDARDQRFNMVLIEGNTYMQDILGATNTHSASTGMHTRESRAECARGRRLHGSSWSE